jgi:hypothetical protein
MKNFPWDKIFSIAAMINLIGAAFLTGDQKTQWLLTGIAMLGAAIYNKPR